MATMNSYSNANKTFLPIKKTKQEFSKKMMRDSAEEACRTHNPKVGGSNPPLAKINNFI